MLTTAGKDWLATHAGSGTPKCYQPSGISYKDADGVLHTGATGDVANALYVAHLVGKDTVPITGDGLNYNDFKTANGGNDLAIDDVGWVYENDGGPGEPQYCKGAAATGFLSVNTSPTGASVSVDGTSCGVTPVTACVVPVGTKTVTITKTGYQTETRPVTITEGETTDLGTITLTPTGKGTLYLATDPGCCSAWIDADPDTDPATIACTKDKTKGEWDTIELDAPATHTIHVRKTGYDDYYDEFEFIAEGQSLSEFPELDPSAGTNTALLTVNAYKEEEKPDKVAVENAVLKKGASKVGFCPYSDYWRADPAGTKYSISVVAEDREPYEADIVLYKDTPKTIDAYLKEKRLEIVIKIAPGVAYIDDISGGDYQVWYVGTLKEGWVRVETFLDEPTMFKAELTFCEKGTTTPVAGIDQIVTEEKLLHSSMSAEDRHLDWPPWLVPDKPGEYSLVAELFYST